jgi:hypothetical protein
VPFEVAVYTDVVAADAVDGVDGFNFQAVSPGVDGGALVQIRERLLHRVARPRRDDQEISSLRPS